MARTLICLKVYLVGLLFLLGSASYTSAQPNTTPGLPWTVVTPDSLPPGAVDTAFEYSMFKYGQEEVSNIRWIYRVNCHIRLTEITDSNTFFVEVPRHPEGFGYTETVERIEMVNPFIDSIVTATRNTYYIGSSNSISHPQYFFPTFSLEEMVILNSRGDTIVTTHFGSFVRIPQRNFIVENISDSTYRSYAYFLQFVDSIWFPRISSVETPRDARNFKTYPNPTTGNFSIELPEDAPTNVGGYIMRIYDPTAKLLDTRRVYSHGALHNLTLPPGGSPGMYTITLYDERGRLAVGRIMKLE